MRLPKINIIPWYIKVGVVVAVIAAGIYFIDRTIDNIKTKITHNHEDFKAVQKSDSLKTFLLAKCVNLSDSLQMKNSDLDEKAKSDSVMFRSINQANQKTILILPKQNAEYKKNGACFVYEKEWIFGKLKEREVNCDSLRNSLRR